MFCHLCNPGSSRLVRMTPLHDFFVCPKCGLVSDPGLPFASTKEVDVMRSLAAAAGYPDRGDDYYEQEMVAARARWKSAWEKHQKRTGPLAENFGTEYIGCSWEIDLTKFSDGTVAALYNIEV